MVDGNPPDSVRKLAEDVAEIAGGSVTDAGEFWRIDLPKCSTCGGSGKQPGEPQPDSFGVYTPCDGCEGTGGQAR